MTDKPSASTISSDDRFTPKWPLSNYLIFLAVALLSGAGLALVVSTEATANRLAKFAYYSLAAGLGLRIAEHAVGSHVHGVPFDSITEIQRMIHPADSGGRPVTSIILRRLMNLVEIGDVRITSALRDRIILAEEIHRGLILAVLLTFVGGALIIVRWWLNPRVLVSSRFLIGWIVVLVGIAGLYYGVYWYSHEKDD